MGHRIGDVHRSRLLSFFGFLLFSFLLVGFAKPRDPRVTAIVVPSLGGETIEVAAHRRLACDGCVVLLVAQAERKMRIETGKDARRALSDEAALRILDDRMRPLLREGRTDDAVDAGVTAIESALAGTSTTKAPESAIAVALAFVAAVIVILLGAVALAATSSTPTATTRRSRRRAGGDVGQVPYVPAPYIAAPPVDTGSGSSGLSGGGGATSSW